MVFIGYCRYIDCEEIFSCNDSDIVRVAELLICHSVATKHANWALAKFFCNNLIYFFLFKLDNTGMAALKWGKGNEINVKFSLFCLLYNGFVSLSKVYCLIKVGFAIVLLYANIA